MLRLLLPITMAFSISVAHAQTSPDDSVTLRKLADEVLTHSTAYANLRILTKEIGGRLAGSFPVDNGDEILLVSDQGQLIRIPVNQVRLAGRNTQGVIIFRKHQDEHVVSVERLAEAGGEDEVDEDPDEGPDAEEAGDAPA